MWGFEGTLQNHSPLQELQQRKAVIAAASKGSPGKVLKKGRLLKDTPDRAAGGGKDGAGEGNGPEKNNLQTAFDEAATLVQEFQ